MNQNFLNLGQSVKSIKSVEFNEKLLRSSSNKVFVRLMVLAYVHHKREIAEVKQNWGKVNIVKNE